jgi:membrane protein implicated in regulation of membrane protease activity
MALLVAILLALFVLSPPWGWIAIAVTAVYEVATHWLGWWWSRSRADVVGPDALVGLAAEVTKACRPDGWVKVQGELWRAHCPEGAEAGQRVRVVAVSRLTLLVERPR